MFYLYLILCEDESIYTGITNNPDRRFSEHKNRKGGRYTKLNKPIKILYTEKFSIKQEALKREKQIKGWRREKKFNLIQFGKPILK